MNQEWAPNFLCEMFCRRLTSRYWKEFGVYTSSSSKLGCSPHFHICTSSKFATGIKMCMCPISHKVWFVFSSNFQNSPLHPIGRIWLMASRNASSCGFSKPGRRERGSILNFIINLKFKFPSSEKQTICTENLKSTWFSWKSLIRQKINWEVGAGSDESEVGHRFNDWSEKLGPEKKQLRQRGRG